MKIDLTCPVELSRYTLPDENNKECCFEMRNLSEQQVVSVQITLLCGQGEDETPIMQTHRFRGVGGEPGGSFELSYEPDIWQESFTHVDVIVEKVWFDNAAQWRRDTSRLTEYTPNTLKNGKALDNLRFVAGEEAVGYPELQQNVWLCLCGRPNPLESESCCRCHRLKEMVFANYSAQRVNALIAEREKTLEKNARQARENSSALAEKQTRQEAVSNKRRKDKLRGVVIGLILILLAIAFVIWGLPAIRYYIGVEKMTAGEYDQARAAFTELENWKDAPQQLLRCNYLEADALLQNKDVESLQKAQKLFSELGSYEDSEDKAKQAAYALGVLYQEQGYYDLAAEAFQNLGDYSDSPAHYLETVYLQAGRMMEYGSYDAARLLYAAIEDYQDAEEKELECSYLLAKKHMEEQNWEAALNELEDLNGYQDADQLIQEARYHLAEEYLANEDYESAAGLFEAAGDYGEAPQKSQECAYLLAKQMNDAGEYEKAMALFVQAGDYQDAPKMAALSRYCLAKAAADSGEDALAVSYYGDGTAEEELSQDAKALLGACHYRLAQKALESGETEAAEAELENAAAYGTAQDELVQLRYSLAEKAFEAENYADALSRYEALGDYKSSTARVKACRYALAAQAAEAKDYDTAIELYKLLGSYKESEKQLKECTYQKALVLIEAGENSAAEELLATLKGEKAKTKLAELRTAMGKACEEAGDYEGAAEIYARMDSKEGETLRKGAVYAQAKSLEDTAALLEAAELYDTLGTYEDAAERKAACLRAYWGDSAENAMAYLQDKDYAATVKELEGKDLEAMSVSYPTLPQVWKEACYYYAESLYNAGEPYQAIPYYQNAGDYNDASGKKLERTPYLLLGDWKAEDGTSASFQSDSLCTIGGTILYFKVNGSNLYTGQSVKDMTITHQITAIDQNQLVLKDIQAEKEYRFTRVGEWNLSAPQPAEEESSSPQEVQADESAV